MRLHDLRPAGVSKPLATSPMKPRLPRARAADLRVWLPGVGIEPTSLVLIQSQAGPASRPTGERPANRTAARVAKRRSSHGTAHRPVNTPRRRDPGSCHPEPGRGPPGRTGAAGMMARVTEPSQNALSTTARARMTGKQRREQLHRGRPEACSPTRDSRPPRSRRSPPRRACPSLWSTSTSVARRACMPSWSTARSLLSSAPSPAR